MPATHDTDQNAIPRGTAAGARPTLKSIAFMTGLSITAVSRALKDAPDISPATKDRVRMAASQVGYKPNRAGVRLRTGRTNVISLILNTSQQVMGLTSDIITGISEVLRQTEYHLILTPYSYGDDPMEPVRYVVESGSADGVILSSIEPNDARVNYLFEKNIPFATHGQTLGGIVHPFHDFDNETFAYDAVGRLAELGVRTAGLLAPSSNLTYALLMERGFRTGLGEHNIGYFALTGVNVDDPLDDIEEYITSIMQSADRPGGVVCGAGAPALPLASGVENAGLVIGKDIHIISKQPINILKRFRPAIEVIDEDFRLAGRDLARSVLGSIRGEPPENLQHFVYR